MTLSLITTILISLVALLHFYFLILEMFLWTKPKGMKTFGLRSKEFAEESKVLAANQGLYNGFLAAGLIFGILSNNQDLTVFILLCVIIAGIYGAYSTRKTKLFLIQSFPAILALISLLIENNNLTI